MIYLGSDTSSKAIHAAAVNPDEELVALYKWSCDTKKTFPERFPELIKNFSDELSTINRIDFATIEASIFAQNRSVVGTLASVVGAVWAILVLQGIPTVRVDNNTWKKDVVGKGNVKKDEIKRFAEEKWGDKFPEQDYADAACIALWNKRRF